MKNLHLFVYGTLTDVDFLHHLTKRPLGYFKIIDAKLPAYKKFSTVKIVKSDLESSVDGRLILNLDERDLKILDRYESCNPNNAEFDENNWYNRKRVTVIINDEKKIKAFTYIPNSSEK